MSEELNPYQSPQTPLADVQEPLQRNRVAGCVRGSLGCGCFIPLVLFLIIGVSGIIDSPPFWPFLVMVGTLAGAVIGTVFAPRKKSSQPPPAASDAAPPPT